MGNCNRSNMGQRECGERYDMSSCQDFALAMAYVPWQHFEHVYEPDRALPVAMAYVPWQYWNAVYDLEKGLAYGTIFPELNKPFYGRKGMRG